MTVLVALGLYYACVAGYIMYATREDMYEWASETISEWKKQPDISLVTVNVNDDFVIIDK